MDVRDQVKHKVACIQDTIAAIADVQQQLKANCLESKSRIHSSISRQLETLRSREIWLLNQVDIIRHAKEERLQGQLACLLHELGGLQHLIQIAQSCGHSCEDLKQELAETLSRLKVLENKPLEEADISFSADVNKLRREICSYGSVGAKGHAMEDYPIPDSLCNSMVGLSLMNQAAAGDPEVVETKFPPFTADTSLSEWLAERDTDDFVVLGNDGVAVMMPEYDNQLTISPPLESVFRKVNVSPLAEWLFESESIAVSSLGISYPYEDVLKYFREISDDVKVWLVDYEKSQQEAMEEEAVKGKDCKTDICHCAGPPDGFVMQPIEIENLDQLTCIQDPVTHVLEEQQHDKNKWLRNYDDRKMESESVPPIVLPSVTSTCRANEPCHCFAECVCDTNCAVTAIAQSNPSLDPEQVLAYFHSVSKNPTDWLAPTPVGNPCDDVEPMHLNTEPNCSWLRKNEENESVRSSNVCEFAYFHSVPANPSHWLQQSSEDSQSPIGVTSPLDTYLQQRSDKVNDWLRKEPLESEEISESTGESTDEENAKWLHHSLSSKSNSLGKSSWEVVQKYHAQLALSDWLSCQAEPKSKSEWLLDSCSDSSVSPSTANVEAFKLFLRLENSGDENQWLKQ